MSVPRAILFAAIVVVIDAFALPSKLTEPVTSPAREIVLALAKALAVVALPDNAAVIVPAAKFPDPSRFTIADAVFAFVAASIRAV